MNGTILLFIIIGISHPTISSYSVTNPPFPGFLDYKTPTLAANNVHFERGVVVPSLNMESEKSCRNRMLEIGHLHCMAVFVTA